MFPSEFLNCTYKQLVSFVNGRKNRENENFKNQIVLADALGNKIIDVIGRKKPKGISLIEDNFSLLFEEELKNKNHQQTIEEQIRNLRSRK